MVICQRPRKGKRKGGKKIEEDGEVTSGCMLQELQEIKWNGVYIMRANNLILDEHSLNDDDELPVFSLGESQHMHNNTNKPGKVWVQSVIEVERELYTKKHPFLHKF